MSNRSKLPSILAILMFISRLMVAESGKQAALSMMDTGRELACLRCDKDPFKVIGHFTISNGKQTQAGSYLLLWKSNEQWKEVVDLPSYQEVVVAFPDKLYIARTLPYEPLQVQIAKTLLSGVYVPPKLLPKMLKRLSTDISVQHKKMDGVELDCVDILPSPAQLNLNCYDPKSGALVVQQLRTKIAESFFRYSNFRAYGTRLPARAGTYIRDSKTLVEAKVDEISPLGDLKGNIFAPPAGAEARDYCADPIPAEIIKTVPPENPIQNRRTNGTVALDVAVQPDGYANDLHVLMTAGEVLDQAAIRAVKEWRFQPPTCNGKSIPMEIGVEVSFDVQ